MCFDILYEGRDLITLPLLERKKILNKYKDTDYFSKTIFIDEKGITKYNILGQIVLQFDWNKIKEIRIDTVWIYVSPWLLANEKKYWNASHLIVFIYSEKIMRVLKQYIPENITTNFESKGQR